MSQALINLLYNPSSMTTIATTPSTTEKTRDVLQLTDIAHCDGIMKSSDWVALEKMVYNLSKDETDSATEH